MTPPPKPDISRASPWVLLVALYLSQGLPYGFFTQALPVILRERGLSLAAIGLSSLLALPWAAKFLWAPFVERTYVARVGRRRSWILPMQGAAIALIALLAVLYDSASLAALMVLVFIVNAISATQDIATDGLAIDEIPAHQRGVANGIQVAGYRVGMVIGGGALLIVAGTIGTSGSILAMAALLAVASVPALLHRERDPLIAERPHAPNGRHAQDAQPTSPRSVLLSPAFRPALALVLVYKLGDAFATAMLRPFLSDADYTLMDIGWIVGTVGFVAGLLGALLGGWLVGPLGRRRALVLFAGVQAVTLLGYSALALGTPSGPAVAVACALEHAAGGMCTAALFTVMMDWSRPGSAATDYTAFASAVVIASGIAAALSGFSAEAFGYAPHFALSAVLAVVAGAAAAVVPARLFGRAEHAS